MKYIPMDVKRLNEIVHLWNRELGDLFPMRPELMKQNSFLDQNVDEKASRIAVNENNEIVGMVVAKRWRETIEVEMDLHTGWIQVLLVDQNYRNRGIGTQLLQHAESRLREKGVSRIWLGKDPWHYFPGVPTENENTIHWFKNRGYTLDGIDHDLINHYVPDESINLTKEGVEISLLKEEEKEDFISFLRRCFPGRWEYEAIKYFDRGGTGREFVVMKKQGKIIGFCRINDPDSPFIAQNVYWAPLFEQSLGGIGPLGIDEEERGQRYGLLIVEAAIVKLRERNIHSIVIDWTGLVKFYQKLGYEIWKSYQSMRKE